MKKMLAFALLLIALPVSATVVLHTGVVSRVLLEEGNYGDCMAQVTPDFEATALNCPYGWVTFSCSGDFNSKSMGNQKLQMAQLSFLTGDALRLKVNDAKLHNGRCFAERIDIQK